MGLLLLAWTRVNAIAHRSSDHFGFLYFLIKTNGHYYFMALLGHGLVVW
jgi:hypothetical protein